MADLTCKYLGLNLRNPLIIGSSVLTDSIDKILQLQDSGAGAVMLKSLYQEEIEFAEGRLIDLKPFSWPGAEEYSKFYSQEHSVDNYLHLIENAKKQVSIPVIASLNCIAMGEWINLAKNIESAGADALEINVFFFPDDKDFRAEDYERMYYDIIIKIAYVVSIPFVVTIGPYFTNILYFIDQIIRRGAKGVVLFNRFFHPDIDIELLELKPVMNLSNSFEFYQTLRWVSIVSSHFNNIEIAASTDICDSESAIKLLLAGANAVLISSVLHKNEVDCLQKIIDGISGWMDKKGFLQIEQFQGQLNYSIIQDPFLYERSQFIKNFNL